MRPHAPDPGQDAMKPQFAEEYRNLEQWHWWFRGRRKILEQVLKQELRHGEPRSIASVGCGPPEGLAWLLPLTSEGGFVLGIDSDHRHARRAGLEVLYMIGDLARAPVRPHTLDVVLALDVLEHLDDDALGLSEAARILKPDGFLLVTVPAGPSLWGAQDIVSHHRRRYTKKSLRTAFQRAGLPPPHLAYFNTLLFPPIAALRWLRRLLGSSDSSRSDFQDNRPGLINDILASVFAFERHVVGRISMPFGVSLLATSRPAPDSGRSS